MKVKFIIFILVLMVLSVSCTAQNSQLTFDNKDRQINTNNGNSEDALNTVDPTSDEIIMKAYISDFLKKGYDKYYIINSIECNIINKTSDNNKIEAIIHVNMNANNLAKNPDTIPYIKSVKDKASEETSPDIRLKLQKEYLTLYSEYLKPFENNFTFKFISDMKDDKINEEAIQLFIETDDNQGIKYKPAEEFLPKEGPFLN